MKFTPKIRELLSEVAYMPWEISFGRIRLDAGCREFETGGWNGLVCPICAVADVHLGDLKYSFDAVQANDDVQLGLTEAEVVCIMRAADNENDHNRKELMELLGMEKPDAKVS